MATRRPNGQRAVDDRAPEGAPGHGEFALGATRAHHGPDAHAEPRGAHTAGDGVPAPDPDPHASDRTASRGLGLSVPQVAASTAAAVSGAFAASGLGVYGTIIGAGVISVVATVGGALYQRLFDKTGEQLRDVARPRGRRDAAPDNPASAAVRTSAAPAPDAIGAPDHGDPPGYTAETEYGVPRRRRLFRRWAVTAVAVFLLTMVAVTGIELATGTSAPQTSVGDLFTRDGGAGGPAEPDDGPADPADRDGDGQGGTGDADDERDTPTSPAPDGTEQPRPGGGEVTPEERPEGTAPDAPTEVPGGPAEPTPGGSPDPEPTDSGDPEDDAPANAPTPRDAAPEE